MVKDSERKNFIVEYIQTYLSNGEGQWEKELNFTIAAVWQIKETIM